MRLHSCLAIGVRSGECPSHVIIGGLGFDWAAVGVCGVDVGDRPNQQPDVTRPVFLPPDLTKPFDRNVHLRLVSSSTRATFDTLPETNVLSVCMPLTSFVLAHQAY